LKLLLERTSMTYSSLPPRVMTASATARLGAAIGAIGSDAFPRKLSAFIGELLPKDEVLIFACQHGRCPVLLHGDSSEAGTAAIRNYWLAGAAYLFSPVYQKFCDGVSDGFYRLDDLLADAEAIDDHYMLYREHAPHSGQVDQMIRVSDADFLWLSLGRFGSGSQFSEDEVDWLNHWERVIGSMAGKHFGPSAIEAHRRRSETTDSYNDLETALARFGSSILTVREHEVLREMMYGRSSKAAARQLGIALSTERVHRRNIYEKLGVSCYGEIFSLFISSAPYFHANDPTSDPLQSLFRSSMEVGVVPSASNKRSGAGVSARDLRPDSSARCQAGYMKRLACTPH